MVDLVIQYSPVCLKKHLMKIRTWTITTRPIGLLDTWFWNFDTILWSKVIRKVKFWNLVLGWWAHFSLRPMWMSPSFGWWHWWDFRQAWCCKHQQKNHWHKLSINCTHVRIKGHTMAIRGQITYTHSIPERSKSETWVVMGSIGGIIFFLGIMMENNAILGSNIIRKIKFWNVSVGISFSWWWKTPSLGSKFGWWHWWNFPQSGWYNHQQKNHWSKLSKSCTHVRVKGQWPLGAKRSISLGAKQRIDTLYSREVKPKLGSYYSLGITEVTFMGSKVIQSPEVNLDGGISFSWGFKEVETILGSEVIQGKILKLGHWDQSSLGISVEVTIIGVKIWQVKPIFPGTW